MVVSDPGADGAIMRRPKSPSSEKGAALLVVLLLVATISALSLTIVQTVSTAYQTAMMSSARNQILWFAIGAEDLASSKLSAASKLTEGRITRNTPGLNERIDFELPGGRLSAVFSDASNCFNLNSLAQSSEDAEATGAINASTYYKDLLLTLGFEPGQANELVSTLQDWLDLDNLPRTGGAEVSYYASLKHPYGPGNTFLVSPTDLRAIKGYSKEVVQRLKPYVCAWQDKRIGPFNVNTLSRSQAPLLVPVFANEIPLSTIEEELQAVEGVEHDSEKEFLARPTFAIVSPDKRLDSLLSDKTSFFRLAGEVVYLDAVTSYEAVFARNKANDIVLVRRRLGVDE